MCTTFLLRFVPTNLSKLCQADEQNSILFYGCLLKQNQKEVRGRGESLIIKFLVCKEYQRKSPICILCKCTIQSKGLFPLLKKTTICEMKEIHEDRRKGEIDIYMHSAYHTLNFSQTIDYQYQCSIGKKGNMNDDRIRQHQQW